MLGGDDGAEHAAHRLDGTGKAGVISLFLHGGDHDAAHSSSGGGAGAGHGRKDHAGHHVHHCQAAGHPAHQLLGKIYDSAGNTAALHQAARNDKEGDRHQSKGIHTLEHLLSNDNKGNLRIERQIQNCGCAQGNGDGNSQEQQDKKCNDQYCQIHFFTSRILLFCVFCVFCDFSFVPAASRSRLGSCAPRNDAPPLPPFRNQMSFSAHISRIAQNILRGFVFYAIFMPILVFFMNFPGKSLFFQKILLILTQITEIHT